MKSRQKLLLKTGAVLLIAALLLPFVSPLIRTTTEQFLTDAPKMRVREKKGFSTFSDFAYDPTTNVFALGGIDGQGRILVIRAELADSNEVILHSIEQHAGDRIKWQLIESLYVSADDSRDRNKYAKSFTQSLGKKTNYIRVLQESYIREVGGKLRND